MDFVNGGEISASSVVKRKKGTEKIINLNRGDGRVCPRNGSDAPGLIPEPIQDKVCGES